MDRYENLANAVIVQACKDYSEKRYRPEVEAFFRSGWFKALTDLDEEILLQSLKKKVEKKELQKAKKIAEMREIKKKRGYQ